MSAQLALEASWDPGLDPAAVGCTARVAVMGTLLAAPQLRVWRDTVWVLFPVRLAAEQLGAVLVVHRWPEGGALGQRQAAAWVGRQQPGSTLGALGRVAGLKPAPAGHRGWWLRLASDGLLEATLPQGGLGGSVTPARAGQQQEAAA